MNKKLGSSKHLFQAEDINVVQRRVQLCTNNIPPSKPERAKSNEKQKKILAKFCFPWVLALVTNDKNLFVAGIQLFSFERFSWFMNLNSAGKQEHAWKKHERVWQISERKEGWHAITNDNEERKSNCKTKLSCVIAISVMSWMCGSSRVKHTAATNIELTCNYPWTENCFAINFHIRLAGLNEPGSNPLASLRGTC